MPSYFQLVGYHELLLVIPMVLGMPKKTPTDHQGIALP